MAAGAAVAVDAQNFVTRPELQVGFDSIRRELSGYAKGQAELRGEMNAKLDQILAQKTEDARAMGRLEEQIRSLTDTVGKQAEEIAEIRRKQDEPRDGAIRFVVDVVKLVIAGAIGFVFAWFGRGGGKG